MVASIALASYAYLKNLQPAYILVTVVALFLLGYFTRAFGHISLTEGSRKAYTDLRGTIWGTAAERLNADQTPEGILNYMAIALTDKLPVFGKFPPSDKLELIDHKEFTRGSTLGGGSIVKRFGQQHPHITELTISKFELYRAIRSMKKQSS